MTDPQLMSYWKFDEADVQANHNGQFTDKQKSRLVQEDKSDKNFRLIGAILLFVIAAGSFVFAIYTMMGNPDPQFRATFGLMFGLVLPGIFAAFGVRTLLRATSKFEVKLMRVEGPVNIIKVERSTTSTASDGTSHTSHYFVYELHIGPTSFDVTGDLAGIMMQGDVYALYYTQGSENEILSAELILKAK